MCERRDRRCFDELRFSLFRTCFPLPRGGEYRRHHRSFECQQRQLDPDSQYFCSEHAFGAEMMISIYFVVVVVVEKTEEVFEVESELWDISATAARESWKVQ